LIKNVNKESIQNASQKEKVNFLWKWKEMNVPEQSIYSNEIFGIKEHS